MNDDDPDTMALRENLERHMASDTPMDIIYFGGGLPGQLRSITPLRYCESRGRSHLIARCHRSGIEKTFRLDRMHLTARPLDDGRNDFRIIATCLGGSRLIECMLAQISRLGNLPMENALAVHHAERGEFASFFEEYAYGGYTLGLSFTSEVISLSLGYEANNYDTIHYHFTPESDPRLTPDIATHYSLYTGMPTGLKEGLMKANPQDTDEVNTPAYPKPENTPGVFLEHFDLPMPIENGEGMMIYPYVHLAAKETAALAGWAFRSYSSGELPSTRSDIYARRLGHFPTLILWRDGIELGRYTAIVANVPGLLAWADKFLSRLDGRE